MSNIEDDIEILESIVKVHNDFLQGVNKESINEKEIRALEHLLSDYKNMKFNYENLIHDISLIAESLDMQEDSTIEEIAIRISEKMYNQQQINEEHQRINGELREKVKELERNSNCDSVYAIKFATMQQQINEKDKRIQELEEERQLVGIPVRNKRDGKIGIVLHQWENGSIAVLERINPRIINTHDSWNTLEIITDEVKQVQTNSDNIAKQKIKDKIEELKNEKEQLRIDKNVTWDSQIYKLDLKIQVLQELLQEEDK